MNHLVAPIELKTLRPHGGRRLSRVCRVAAGDGSASRGRVSTATPLTAAATLGALASNATQCPCQPLFIETGTAITRVTATPAPPLRLCGLRDRLRTDSMAKCHVISVLHPPVGALALDNDFNRISEILGIRLIELRCETDGSWGVGAQSGGTRGAEHTWRAWTWTWLWLWKACGVWHDEYLRRRDYRIHVR